MFKYVVKNGNSYAVIQTNIFFHKGDVYNCNGKQLRIICFA